MNDVNQKTKGLVLMLAGAVLFLYAFGILDRRLVMIAVALFLLLLGVMQISGFAKKQK